MGISTDMTNAAAWVGRKCRLLSGPPAPQKEGDLIAHLAAKAAARAANQVKQHEEWVAGLPPVGKAPTCPQGNCIVSEMAYTEPPSFGGGIRCLPIRTQSGAMKYTCNRCKAQQSTKTASWKPYVAEEPQ